MSNLVRSVGDSPISEFFRWLDLNRPSRLSDVTHYIPVESDTGDGHSEVRYGSFTRSLRLPKGAAVQRAEGDAS